MSMGKDVRAALATAKQLLSVPALMETLGLGERAKKNARCPFHSPDNHPSFSVFEKDGKTFWKCHAGCGDGDQLDFLVKLRGYSIKEAIVEFLRLAGASVSKRSANKPTPGKSAQAAAANAAPAVQPRPLGELLDTVCGILRRYVVFPLREQVAVISVWIAHTWAFGAFDYTAYLFVFSATKRSGKSRVLEVIEQLARNPQLTEGSTSAALMRSVDESNLLTILLDEVDTIYKGKGDAEAENTRRFLNAGYRRGAKFLRCVGQGADIQVKEFPAFCPKVLAGIDRCLPDTVLDRSVPIELERQSRNEKAERFRRREAEAVAAPIRAGLEAWVGQPGVMEALRNARPTLPEELSDRAQDISEPLIAIADLAGGIWPEKLRNALIKLCGEEEDTDTGVKLLQAIKRVFDHSGKDKLPTIDILEGLVAIEDDAPWALWYEDDLKHGKLKKAGSHLARKLKRYKIKPGKIRFGDDTAQGYYRSQFEKCWERYLPASSRPFEINGTNGTMEQNIDFARENDVPSPIPSTRNVPLSVQRERNTKHEAETQNVPNVPSVLSPGSINEVMGDKYIAERIKQLLNTEKTNATGMTPGQFLAEAANLFNATPAKDGGRATP
jgi:Protein of unknown function (DUF3631)/CHC2 zinc finger